MSGNGQWIVESEGGNRREVGSRAEAESVKEDMEQFDMNAEIIPPERGDGAVSTPVPTGDAPDDSALATQQFPDPLDHIPGWMVDRIDRGSGPGTPHLNKRGCQVIAEHLGLIVQSEALKRADETDWEYAVYRASARSDHAGDAQEFTATGVAHIDEGGRNLQDLDLVAETRAKKRAVKWAAGGGIRPFREGNRG